MSTRGAPSAAHLARLLGRSRPDGPAYVALAAGLRGLLLDGRLPLATRLPSERDLAVALGHSRTTTTAAYDVLRAEGWLASRRGAGSWTALPPDAARAEVLPLAAGGSLDLAVAALPAPPELADCAMEAAAELPRHLGGHGYGAAGLPALREAVAAGYAARGLPTTADQVLITAGALHAVDLVLRLLISPGDTVLAESPSYPAALEALRAHGARPLHLPVDVTTGWDLTVLRATLRRAAPTLAYLIPDFGPSGALVPGPQRAALVAAARRAGTWVVADETFADLGFAPADAPPPLAASDTDGRVLTLGSASKAFWGGLRVGWVRTTPELVHRLAAVRVAVDMASPVLEQLVVVRLLERAAGLLATRRALLAERCDLLRGLVAAELPGWSVPRPAGGMALWATLASPVSSGLAARAAQEGVRLAPGPRFGAPGTLERHTRLPFTLPPADLAEAVRRLAVASGRLGERGGGVEAAGWVA